MRQIVNTFYTPEEKEPPEDITLVITVSGETETSHYIHAVMTGQYLGQYGWMFDGIDMTRDDINLTVESWAEVDPYWKEKRHG